MRTHLPSRPARAFTLVEVMTILGVLVILVFMFMPRMPNRSRAQAQRIQCINNLKQTAVAFRLWSNDHSDEYPMQVATNKGGTLELADGPYAFLHFQVLSNELSTPKILVCPADPLAKYATNFTPDLDNAKISYFVGVDVTPTNVQMFLAGDRNITNGLRKKYGILELTTNQLSGWTHEIHQNMGNVGLGDGSVQQFTTSRLRVAIAYSGAATNRLAMP